MKASKVFSETSLEVDVSRACAGRTCLMFVCVHLFDEVTQRVHTSLDVIAMTHLCDSGHNQAKESFITTYMY